MEQYVGLDVSLELTSVCLVDSGVKSLWQGKCVSTPEAIAATIRARALGVARVGLESGPLSAWHWHELRKLGVPVVCLDARHAKAARRDYVARGGSEKPDYPTLTGSGTDAREHPWCTD